MYHGELVLIGDVREEISAETLNWLRVAISYADKTNALPYQIRQHVENML